MTDTKIRMTQAVRLSLFGALALLLAVPAAALLPGDEAPAFKLTDTAGAEHELAAYLADGKIVVLEWFNPDCPFIKKHHGVNKTMDETFAKVADRDVVWLAINDDRSPAKLGETNHVAAALTAVIAGEAPETAATVPYGCSVKYGK